MKTGRRAFLYTSGVLAGAAVLPAWVAEREAEAAAAVDPEGVAVAALKRAKRGRADYADVRVNRYRTESIRSREKLIQQVQRRQSYGIGVRALKVKELVFTSVSEAV